MDKRTMLTPLSLTTAAGLGGALMMYLLDPERGPERRAAVAQRASRLTHRAVAAAAAGGDRLWDRGDDLLDDARRQARALRRRGEDWGLRQRDEWQERADDWRARHEVDDEDATDLLRHAAPGPLLLALVASGVALAAYAWSRRARERVSGDAQARQRGMELRKSVDIDAPLETVFDLWANHENFPRFMSNVEEVRPLGGDRSHWVVKGPAGSRVEFDSVLTEHRRPRLLAWRSEPGGEVENEGSVRLEPSGKGTRATVTLSYRPPAGALGHVVATLLGRNPAQELEDDLQRMKVFIETGVPVRGAAVGDGQDTALSAEHAGARPGIGSRAGNPGR